MSQLQGEGAHRSRTAAAKTIAKPTASLSSDESRMVAAINTYRANYKLLPLSADPLLETIARQRVGVFNHNHPRFGWVWQQAHRQGFPGPALITTCTDNLTQGQTSPDEVAAGWATSDGHARQMRGQASMNGAWQECHFNLCGVAHEGQNYIAVFGRREGEQRCDCAETGVCNCGAECRCDNCPIHAHTAQRPRRKDQ